MSDIQVDITSTGKEDGIKELAQNPIKRRSPISYHTNLSFEELMKTSTLLQAHPNMLRASEQTTGLTTKDCAMSAGNFSSVNEILFQLPYILVSNRVRKVSFAYMPRDCV